MSVNNDHYCPLCKHLMGASGTKSVEKCWNCMKKFKIIEIPNKSVDEFFSRVNTRRNN